MTKKTMLVALLALLGALALVVVGGAGGAAAKKPPKGKPSLSATPVFKLRLKPSQEVPAIKGLRADAVGSVTFDLTRNSAGAITSGEVIFYFNYAFPGSVTISGRASVWAASSAARRALPILVIVSNEVAPRW